MRVPLAVRDSAVGLGLTTAFVAGLIGLTPLPWVVGLLAAVLLGGVLLIADVLIFRRPFSMTSVAGRRTVWGAGVLAGVSALFLAFFVGGVIQDDPEEYLFVVNKSQVLVKSVPNQNAGRPPLLEGGQDVRVRCYVTLSDGRWYQLSDEQGWLQDTEVLAAPFTGGGSPPKCPS